MMTPDEALSPEQRALGKSFWRNQPLALEYIGYIATSTIATWVAARCSERPASAIQGLVDSANTGVFAIQI
jgi:hypothetical protein